MKNSFKNLIIVTGIVLSLGLGTYSNVCFSAPSPMDKAVNNDIEAITRKPVSKKDMALKFVMAMFGVVASSVVIYVVLSMYNKVSSGSTESIFSGFTPNKDNFLKTPENFKEAINSFLNKTDWN